MGIGNIITSNGVYEYSPAVDPNGMGITNTTTQNVTQKKDFR